jgi:methionine aminotransferase
MSNKVKEQGGINLAQGIPGFQPPSELLGFLSSYAHKSIHQYAPGTGNYKLLNLLAQKYSPFGNFREKDFLITNGGTEAVSLLYTYFSKILQKPYSALAFEPVYESYKQLPWIFNDDFIPFSLNGDNSVDFVKLKEICIEENVKVIFLNTPGNPLGKIWKEQEVRQLMEMSKELQIFVIIDAVYEELYFYDKPYNPINEFSDNVFYVNSFSKLFSITGWRIGYLIASEKHMSRIQSVHDYTGLSAPSVLQAALAEYLSKSDWGKDYIVQLREKIRNGFYKLKEGLIELGFKIPHIEGGFFIWTQLPEPWQDGFDFTMDLYEKEKVAVIPGEHFSEKSTDYIRLNIARESGEIEEALRRIKAFFTDTNIT